MVLGCRGRHLNKGVSGVRVQGRHLNKGVSGVKVQRETPEEGC